jgi:hypothetical protein
VSLALRIDTGTVPLSHSIYHTQALTQEGDQMVPLVDPSYNEAQRSNGVVSLACMPAMSTVTNMYFTGNASRDIVKQVRALKMH